MAIVKINNKEYSIKKTATYESIKGIVSMTIGISSEIVVMSSLVSVIPWCMFRKSKVGKLMASCGVLGIGVFTGIEAIGFTDDLIDEIIDGLNTLDLDVCINTNDKASE